MEQSELLRSVVQVFERLNVPYFVTGSMATIFYGEPRMTNDIDIVADLRSAHVESFCAAFAEEEYYLSKDAVRHAINARGQFNIIHPSSGLKVDVMIPSHTPFDRSRFSRVARVRLAADFEADFSSPEDVIIKKMEFYRDGRSDKHLRDIAGVLKISGDRIDRAYIDGWAKRLGVQDIWTMIVAQCRDAQE